MKGTIRQLFGVLWLPLFMLIGVSWLLAPALSHEHYGILRLISNEEASRGPAGSWFRVGDVTAAILLLIALWAFKVGKHGRWFSRGVLAAAILAAVDGLFPDTCYLGHASCGIVASGISGVHDTETVLLVALVAFLSIVDSFRLRRASSIGFVILQLSIALLLVSGLPSKQLIVVLQYVYETAVIIWLGWLIDRYNPVQPAVGHERQVRRLVASWVALVGVFTLVTAIPHLRFTHDLRIWNGTPAGLLLQQHNIIAGVLLLYVARHLLRGERPALWLAVVLFYSQVIKYSLLTPQPVGLILYALLLAMLIYARHGFDRNTEPPTWFSRLGDISVMFGGLLMAAIIGFGVLTLTGHRSRFLGDIQHMYSQPYHVVKRHASVSERTEARLRVLSETLGISLGAVTLWSLFRPKSFRGNVEYAVGDRQRFERLLQRYSRSSEDYFKLWPADKSYFFVRGVSGGIAYRVSGGIAFVLADPIASGPTDRQKLLTAFQTFARRHGWVVCVLVIGVKSPDLYKQANLQVMQIGSSAVIDIETFAAKTVRGKWWRWQRNRAERSGWRYEKLVPPHSAETMRSCNAISTAWLDQPGRSEQGFALGYYDEAYLQACALHVLRDSEDKVIAFANELPLYGTVKQASVDLVRHMPEADGAMPALLMHIIEGLRGTAYRTFDLGFVPLAQLENDLARLLRRISSNRFSAAGLEQFKNKFEPDWRPDYIAYDGDLLDLARIAANLERLLKVEDKPQEHVQ